MHSSIETFVCEEEKKVIESRTCRFKVVILVYKDGRSFNIRILRRFLLRRELIMQHKRF